MTRNEMYAKYLEWAGTAAMTEEELFRTPIMNRDMFENETMVVNHLYFVATKFDGERVRCLVFYEANTFMKETNGDLRLTYSVVNLQDEEKERSK